MSTEKLSWRAIDVRIEESSFNFSLLQDKSSQVEIGVGFSAYLLEDRKFKATFDNKINFIDVETEKSNGYANLVVSVFFDLEFDLPDKIDQTVVELNKEAAVISAGIFRSEVINLMRTSGLKTPFIIPIDMLENSLAASCQELLGMKSNLSSFPSIIAEAEKPKPSRKRKKSTS